jgi:hypothetical protein
LTLFTFHSILNICKRYMPQPIDTQAEFEKGGGTMTKKKVLNELARRQEAKFWAMMRAAEPGKRCLK